MAANNADKVSNNLFYLAEDKDVTPYEWDDMPEFVQEDKLPYEEVLVRFRNQSDLDEFAKLVGQMNITEKTKRKKSIWYPPVDRDANTLVFWMDEEDEE